MSVGANIRKRRTELRMSQQELADAMGYKTRSTIAKIESGENDVSQNKLKKFAAALNTTVEMLILGGSSSPARSAAPAFMNPETGKNVVVILAGGNTCQNRQNIPSQFITVHGKPIIVHCMEVYQSHPAIDDIYVVFLKGWGNIVTAYAKQYGITKLKGVIPGGETGIASLKNAVDYIKDMYTGDDLLIIQESTRPMITSETISQLLLSCTENGSATMCHSMKEYVQFCMKDGKASYLDRNAMIALQSPEAHKLSLVQQVFENAIVEQQPLLDSCFAMLMYRLGYNIHFLESTINNIKISAEEDIAAFSSLINHN